MIESENVVIGDGTRREDAVASFGLYFEDRNVVHRAVGIVEVYCETPRILCDKSEPHLTARRARSARKSRWLKRRGGTRRSGSPLS